MIERSLPLQRQLALRRCSHYPLPHAPGEQQTLQTAGAQLGFDAAASLLPLYLPLTLPLQQSGTVTQRKKRDLQGIWLGPELQLDLAQLSVMPLATMTHQIQGRDRGQLCLLLCQAGHLDGRNHLVNHTGGHALCGDRGSVPPIQVSQLQLPGAGRLPIQRAGDLVTLNVKMSPLALTIDTQQQFVPRLRGQLHTIGAHPIGLLAR